MSDQELLRQCLAESGDVEANLLKAGAFDTADGARDAALHYAASANPDCISQFAAVGIAIDPARLVGLGSPGTTTTTEIAEPLECEVVEAPASIGQDKARWFLDPLSDAKPACTR